MLFFLPTLEVFGSCSVVQLRVVQLTLRVIDYVESSICEERSNLGSDFQLFSCSVVQLGVRSVELFSWEWGTADG